MILVPATQTGFGLTCFLFDICPLPYNANARSVTRSEYETDPLCIYYYYNNVLTLIVIIHTVNNTICVYTHLPMCTHLLHK